MQQFYAFALGSFLILCKREEYVRCQETKKRSNFFVIAVYSQEALLFSDVPLQEVGGGGGGDSALKGYLFQASGAQKGEMSLTEVYKG